MLFWENERCGQHRPQAQDILPPFSIWDADVVVEVKKEVDVVVVGIVTIFEGTIGEMTIFGVAIDATIEGIQCRTATSITKEVQE
jgi:hypothetical protein